ncbi:LamG domain-containing protein [Sphingomonas sp. CL5.1]|uniref:LamG-like jellyroll fold domain-containing protein n=1 Tax=Sphingomonas sp. CL5.1 TaxID=2653203 RepID=UPI00159B21A0|nr:LamG-like jellyroll fold domain-containing protein [Sphingomonas sp. CL5.1]QKR99856.1 LamG domain-containing protein [Sphingomonas sp. CL5.1]
MKISVQLRATVGAVAFGMLALAVTPAAAQTYQQAVQATNPEAYFRLTDPAAGSTNGSYNTTYQGSVATGAGAPLASDPGNTGAVFDGVNNGNPGMISTSLSGGVPGMGTILAWVNLAALPGTTGTFQYVAGESQGGNDFDLQFETDNALRFYTGGGENTAFTADPTTLVGQWHLIAATYDSTLGSNSFRDIYWDGALGAGYTGVVNGADKSSPFTIGYSSAFGGREFDGSIDEVAVYNRALSASDISAIYAARLNTGTVAGVPEPASWAMMIFGFGMIGAGLRFRRRRTAVRYTPA